MMHDIRRHTRSGGSAAGGEFVEAHDAVDGNVVAYAHEVAFTGILDDEVLICYAAAKWARIDAAFPTAQS